MGKLLSAIVFGIVGAIVLAIVTLLGGFGLAMLVDKSGSQGLGALVPMVFTPLAFLAGLGGGARYGWKRA